jgi:two-component system sensor histidine kinase BarA
MQAWGLKSKILIINAAILSLTILSLLIVFIVKHEDLAKELTISRGIAASQQLALMSRQAGPAAEILQQLATTQLEERGVRSVRIEFDNKIISAGPRMRVRGELQSYDAAADVSLYQCADGLQFVSSAETADGLTVSIEYANHFLYTQHYQLLFTASLFAAVLFTVVIGMVPVLTSGYSQKMQSIRAAIDEAIATDGISTIPANSAHPGTDELSRIADQLNTLWQHTAARELELRRNADQTARDFRETLETLEVQNIELDIARKEAIKVSQLKSEFLANTSHEIRTPLNGIIGFSNLLAKTQMSGKQRELIQTIHESANGLLRIINDILDFSKIEAGKLTLEYMTFSLYDLIEDSLSLMTPTIHDKPIDLNLIYDAEVPEHIQGDPARLKQVLTNLIHNAIKFTSAGHVTARVKKLNNREISISVSDTGIGLSKEQQENLFEAFSQADQSTSRQYGGTGLGLAIAQRLIKQMGSQIHVDSQPGSGASFHFTLALSEEDEQDADYPQALGMLNVLYLDPEESVDYTLHQLLQRWAMQNTRCNSFDELSREVASANADHTALVIVLRSALLQNKAQMKQLLQWRQQYKTLFLLPSYKLDIPPELEGNNLLQLPFRRASLAAALLESGDYAQTEPEVPVKTDTCRGQLLLVDDNESNLKLLQLLLDQLDCQHASASNGEAALALCNQQRFDCILMDIQMPGLSGTETTLRLRQNSLLNKNTPVIAVTAHAQSEERQNFINAGMNDYLGKPIMEDDLKRIIDKWCCHELPAPVAIDLCLQRAGNKPDLALDMLSGLIASLPEFKQQLEQNLSPVELREAVHSLHGVCCYSGVPALQAACYQLESAIKDNDESLPQRKEALKRCVDEVLQWADEHELSIIFGADV